MDAFCLVGPFRKFTAKFKYFFKYLKKYKMVEDLLKLKNFLENGALTLASLIKWAVLPSTKFELLNQFEGEFWVLVNGPSLTKSIESGGDVWKERNTLCVNNFALSELYPRIQPKFYLLHDPFFLCRFRSIKTSFAS